MSRSVLLILIALFLFQTAAEVEINAEPHHHLIFTNDQVRVFNVEVPAGSQTLMHWHHHDYIYVTIGPTELSNEVEGKPPVTLKLQDGETRFSPGPFAHLVRVSPGQPFHNITVELLQDEKFRRLPEHRDPAHPEEDRGLNILNGGTEEILFVKDGVRVSEVELQPHGVVRISTNPQLLIAVTNLHLIYQGPPNVPHSLSTDVDRRSGEVVWHDHGRHLLTNYTNAVAKFVILEFH
jgi:hypothetical protein